MFLVVEKSREWLYDSCMKTILALLAMLSDYNRWHGYFTMNPSMLYWMNVLVQ